MWKLAPVALLIIGWPDCQSIEPPPAPPQFVVVRVFSDPGEPVSDAGLLFNGKKVSTTDAEGMGKLRLGGRDGEVFDVTVACPRGFESPTKPIKVALKRLADPTKMPEYTVFCPPSTRAVVVAVRADNGENTPITYLGREVGRTDGSGAAHVLLNLQPGEQFSLTLDTTGDDKKDMRPQNPVASFAVGQQDDIFVFDQKFEREKKVIYRGPARPKGPVKIGN
jgi:hypothetical protein